MATRDGMVRNLRYGQLVVKDGAGSPASLTLVLDEGDLSWTEKDDVAVIYDRQTIMYGIPKKDQPCELKFSTKWTQLIGKSHSSTYAIEFYEMVNNLDSTFTSVGTCGEVFQLKYEFTVTSPCGSTGNSEKVTFNRVFKTSLELGENEEANKISFSGTSLEVRPTITRV